MMTNLPGGASFCCDVHIEIIRAVSRAKNLGASPLRLPKIPPLVVHNAPGRRVQSARVADLRAEGAGSGLQLVSTRGGCSGGHLATAAGLDEAGAAWVRLGYVAVRALQTVGALWPHASAPDVSGSSSSRPAAGVRR